ncbi:hypothetical protein BTA51_13810 [Hahella sp. CCB-MM4]|uniref:hypothetical protein n=1 Tax=Hahella sp. (strain CCB-MM4) TaxID=1926491 RepID=UPI000B9C544D|nr:hypothetical protein [Hahella sp. CCB-MM4]OZG73024.1 hypothetical protein BTA51_13810 [Hahella sp. CCB-MM4]
MSAKANIVTSDLPEPNTDLSAIKELATQSFSITSAPPPNGYKELLQIVAAALKFFPPLYVQSIFGPVLSWLPPHEIDSEFNIIDIWRPLRTVDYLVDVTVPARSHAPNRWLRTILPPVVQHFFWRPSNYFQQPDPFASDNSFANEQWFFINGVATNEAVAHINSTLLSKLFYRPFTVIHNATDSLVVDLLECAVGKTFKTDPNLSKPQTMTEPTIKATIAILEALKDPQKDKVVVICHSQGTIITANVLRALRRALLHIDLLRQDPDSLPALDLQLIDELALEILLRGDLLQKTKKELDEYLTQIMSRMEVYTFANCADRMTYVAEVKNNKGEKVGLPYIENFANQFDLVARLGVLSPLKESDPSLIKIDGPLFEKTGMSAWGHLLNQHYLFGIQDFLDGAPGQVSNPYQAVHSSGSPAKNSPPKLPRLYGYYNGGRPRPYYE